jgi:hypothetical protein
MMVGCHMPTSLGLLSLCPRVREDAGKLILTTGLKTGALTLGLSWRRVVVDPATRTVHVWDRHGWLVAREVTIPFKRIVSVTQDYADLSPGQWLPFGYDAFDVYRVGLRLRGDGGDVHLFRFIGEGAYVNNSDMPDWVHGREILTDVKGMQDREASAAAGAIGKMIGVRVHSAV